MMWSADAGTPWVGTWVWINAAILLVSLVVVAAALVRRQPTIVLGVLLAGHGLVHLIGTATAFGWTRAPGIGPVPQSWGVVWLIAALLFVVCTILLWVRPSAASAACVVAIVVSMTAVIHFWSDARFGAVMNGLIVLALLAWRRRERSDAAA